MENQVSLHRISIYACEANNVLSRVLQTFSKSRFAVRSIQIFDTEDVHLKLIIVEASFPIELMSLIINRIEKIIEVHRAFPHQDEGLETVNA